jgi:hypothetical protein
MRIKANVPMTLCESEPGNILSPKFSKNAHNKKNFWDFIQKIGSIFNYDGILDLERKQQIY